MNSSLPIPQEVFMIIFSMLTNPLYLFRCAQISKNLLILSSDDILWRPLFLKCFDIKNFNKNIDLATENNIIDLATESKIIGKPKERCPTIHWILFTFADLFGKQTLSLLLRCFI